MNNTTQDRAQALVDYAQRLVDDEHLQTNEVHIAGPEMPDGNGVTYTHAGWSRSDGWRQADKPSIEIVDGRPDVSALVETGRFVAVWYCSHNEDEGNTPAEYRIIPCETKEAALAMLNAAPYPFDPNELFDLDGVENCSITFGQVTFTPPYPYREDPTVLSDEDLARVLDNAAQALAAAHAIVADAESVYGPLAEEQATRKMRAAWPTASKVVFEPETFDNGVFLVFTGAYDAEGELVSEDKDEVADLDWGELEADLTTRYGIWDSTELTLR